MQGATQPPAAQAGRQTTCVPHPPRQVLTKLCLFTGTEMLTVNQGSIDTAINTSRKRLGVDAVDLMQFYWGDYGVKRCAGSTSHSARPVLPPACMDGVMWGGVGWGKVRWMAGGWPQLGYEVGKRSAALPGRYVDGALYLSDAASRGLIRHVGVTNFDTPRMEAMTKAGVRLTGNQVWPLPSLASLSALSSCLTRHASV
jgi:diketogulonate reductase-like aldo/keto reductase